MLSQKQYDGPFNVLILSSISIFHVQILERKRDNLPANGAFFMYVVRKYINAKEEGRGNTCFLTM